MARTIRGTTSTVISTLLAGVAVPAVGADVPAAEPDPAALQRRLEQTEKRLHDLADQISAEQQQLDADRRALDVYRQGSESDLGQATAKGAAPGTDQPKPVGEAPKPPDAPAAAQIFEEPTALTPHGKWVLEPSVQYVNSTNNVVALVGYTILPAITIGLIDIQRVQSNLTDLTLTGRYGLASRWEVEVKVPWIYTSQSTVTRPLATPSVTNSFFDASGQGIGDVEVAIRHQFNHFRGDNVVWIGTLRYKADTGKNVFETPRDPDTGLQTELPTGSGFNAIQPGFTFIFPSDPAVFFGGAAYTYSFSRNVGHGFGTVNPGGILDMNVGMGLALNERASFSFGYQHSVVSETTQNPDYATGRALARVGTIQLGTLRLGLSYRLNQKTTVNFTLGIGVTGDTPDLELTLRVPYSF